MPKLNIPSKAILLRQCICSFEMEGMGRSINNALKVMFAPEYESHAFLLSRQEPGMEGSQDLRMGVQKKRFVLKDQIAVIIMRPIVI